MAGPGLPGSQAHACWLLPRALGASVSVLRAPLPQLVLGEAQAAPQSPGRWRTDHRHCPCRHSRAPLVGPAPKALLLLSPSPAHTLVSPRHLCPQENPSSRRERGALTLRPRGGIEMLMPRYFLVIPYSHSETQQKKHQLNHISCFHII